ncbi:MAG: methyltransferase domain-containing protein [Actinocatenispora sp.]
MKETVRSWALDRPINATFATPRGLTGRLAGMVMRRKGKQDEVVDLLDVRPGQRVLEVGYGPGALVRQLVERTGAASVRGVDPSPTMRSMARRHNSAGIAAGRVELGIGTAERTDCPDAAFDRVVSVSTVAVWPDLRAGLRECHRVVRPGGLVVVTWHSADAPSRVARSRAMPDDRLDLLEDTMRDVFGDVTRHSLTFSVAFAARRAH